MFVLAEMPPLANEARVKGLVGNATGGIYGTKNENTSVV
jgi:hypothetical protein